LHHSWLAESLQFFSCHLEALDVRAIPGILLISSDFLSLSYAPADFLFGIFPSLSIAIMT
jgi:hypothetical protein